MNKVFICIYDNYQGHGKSLKEAYDDCCDSSGEEILDSTECEFFEADRIEVEFQIVKKESVKSIKKTENICR